MFTKNVENFQKEKVTNFNSQGTTIRWLRRPEESTHFMLRRFDIEPKGLIGLHSHPEEHQIYILKGPIILIDKNKKETVINTDDFVYNPPNEPHGYRNETDCVVSFICGIPKLEKK